MYVARNLSEQRRMFVWSNQRVFQPDPGLTLTQTPGIRRILVKKNSLAFNSLFSEFSLRMLWFPLGRLMGTSERANEVSVFKSLKEMAPN